MKKIIALILLSTTVIFTGCSTHKDTEKVIEEAQKQIENKNYDEADVSLKSILGQDNEEGVANKLHSAIQNYDKAKDAFDSGKVEAAKDALNNIDMNYIKNGMADDVSNLKNKVEHFSEVSATVNNLLSNAKEFIDNNKLDQYKQDLIKRILDSVNNSDNSDKAKDVFNVLEKIKDDIANNSGVVSEVKTAIDNKIDEAINKKVVADPSEEGRKNSVLSILDKAQKDISNVINSNITKKFDNSTTSSSANYGTTAEKEKNITDILDKGNKAINDVLNSITKLNTK